MDKDSLPKLEIEGFTNETKKTRPPKASRMLREKMAEIARKAGNGIKSIRTRNIQSERKPEQNEADIKYRRLLIKTGVCAAIAVMILGIASINTPDAKVITKTISSTVNHQFNMDEDIGRLKFVENLNDNTQSVFSPLPAAAAVYPAEGEIIVSFGQAGSQGVRIKPVGTQIVSIAKGTVDHIGKASDKDYIEVTLDTGEDVLYYNISPSVKVHDIVTAGQEIGNITGDYLYLELKSGDKYIDPIAYIKQREAAAVK